MLTFVLTSSALAALENNAMVSYHPHGWWQDSCHDQDAQRRLTAATTPQTIVVVAPRILLANQLL